MKPICIYHSNCADGFGAAVIVHDALYGEVDFHPGKYGEAPPDIAGRDVIIVDFSYKRDVMLGIMNDCKSLVVLDHHKSAQAELDGLGPLSEKLFIEFDMNRSGAMMAWNFYNPGEAPPKLIKHIQDRDLWKFELEGTRQIQAALFSYPYDFDIWMKLLADDDAVEALYSDGVAIERKYLKDLDELLKHEPRTMVIGGYTVPVANLPYFMASDAGNRLALNQPFAAIYSDTKDNRLFSLRSCSGEHEVDVSEIAGQYGGGGHKNAAGFKVPLEKLVELNLL